MHGQRPVGCVCVVWENEMCHKTVYWVDNNLNTMLFSMQVARPDKKKWYFLRFLFFFFIFLLGPTDFFVRTGTQVLKKWFGIQRGWVEGCTEHGAEQLWADLPPGSAVACIFHLTVMCVQKQTASHRWLACLLGYSPALSIFSPWIF